MELFQRFGWVLGQIGPSIYALSVTDSLIEVSSLRKTYRQGFWMKQVEAVKNVSLRVDSGAIFGFLGPNGAGKTTTIKVLTGLIAPSSGSAHLFGLPVSSPQARAKLGFLPENPYVYPYLTPREFVKLSGRLSGMRGSQLVSRVAAVLGQLGIAYAADRPVRRLSKGMLQRAGLAAALVADPELLILDEPMSGLDPVGRREVRDLILHERSQGRTIFFSSHILTDVETLCDRVAILRKGEVVVSGELCDLLHEDVKRTSVTVDGADEALAAFSERQGHRLRRVRGRAVVDVEGDQALQGLLRHMLTGPYRVAEVAPQHETLEDLFVREALESNG